MYGLNSKAANFEVFEVSTTGTQERLLARLSVFDDAKAIAEIGRSKPRVVVHYGEIVWPDPRQLENRAAFGRASSA